MERRRFKRIVIMLEAEIISGSESYTGYLEDRAGSSDVSVYTYAGTIEDISEGGMLISIPEITNPGYNLGERLEVAFELPSGERLNLLCLIARFQDKGAPDDPGQKMGMEIIDPPPVFRKFVRSIIEESK